MKHACYMSVENDCNIRLTYMLPCACYCLLDVTCALFRIGIVLGGERRDKKKGVHRIEPGSTDT